MGVSEARLTDVFSSSPVIRSRDLAKAGIPRIVLSRAIKAGQIKRLARGLYSLKDFRQSENGDLALVAGKAPDAVICLLSALRFHGLTTQAPSEVWIALQNKTWRPHIDYPAIQITRFSPDAWTCGVSRHIIEGIPVKVTSVEKTIADCFKFRNKVGIDVAIEALKDAKSKKAINWDELWRYAKVDRVISIIRPYMEALA